MSESEINEIVGRDVREYDAVNKELCTLLYKRDQMIGCLNSIRHQLQAFNSEDGRPPALSPCDLEYLPKKEELLNLIRDVAGAMKRKREIKSHLKTVSKVSL